jgi:hypothetical protein
LKHDETESICIGCSSGAAIFQPQSKDRIMKKKKGRLLERTLARDLSREELEHISGGIADTSKDTTSGLPIGGVDD